MKRFELNCQFTFIMSSLAQSHQVRNAINKSPDETLQLLKTIERSKNILIRHLTQIDLIFFVLLCLHQPTLLMYFYGRSSDYDEKATIFLLLQKFDDLCIEV